MDVTIREIQEHEYPLLDHFLYEAIFVPEGVEPPPKTIIASPELQVYVAHFGEAKDDWGLAAEVGGQIVGAVWVRIMNDYGHIDKGTPSLAISLDKEYRGLGMGTAMMKEMLALLKAHGYKQVSLSVQKAKHAFWCANRLPYPITQKSFHAFLENNVADWTESAYIATEDNGQAVGFFCYSVNTEDNIGFLKFVIVDKTKRGKGYGKEMLTLALQYAFQITGAEAVQLNVFSENTPAKHCYEKVSFVERNVDKNVFPFKDELWSRCNMVASKQSFH